MTDLHQQSAYVYVNSSKGHGAPHARLDIPSSRNRDGKNDPEVPYHYAFICPVYTRKSATLAFTAIQTKMYSQQRIFIELPTCVSQPGLLAKSRP